MSYDCDDKLPALTCKRDDMWSDPSMNFFGTTQKSGTSTENNAKVIFVTAPYISSLAGDPQSYGEASVVGTINLNNTSIEQGETVTIKATFTKAIDDQNPPKLKISDTNNNETTVTMTKTTTTEYTYDYTFNSESGTVTLSFTDGLGELGAALRSIPNGTGSFTVTVPDTTAPRISTINRYDPTASATSDSTPIFRVTFDENVTGVNQSDFVTGGTGTSSVTGFTANSATQYDVGVTVTIDGTVSLGLNSGHGIADTASNALTNTTPLTTAQTYTVTLPIVDVTAPIITIPDDITKEATAKLTPLTSTHYGTATATDIIDSNPTITNNATATFKLGKTIIEWIATDSSGNSAKGTQTITIIDTTKPNITAPAAQSFNATAVNTSLSQSDYGTATGSDIFTPVTITSNATGTFSLGDTDILWTATDANGLFDTATQTITIEDKTAPTITLVNSTMTIEVYSTFTDPGYSASDNVDGNVTSSVSVSGSVDTNTLGTYYLSYDVSDDAENDATQVKRTVDVVDRTVPEITAPNDYTAEATETNTPLSQSDYGTPTVTDNYDTSLTITNDAPDKFPLGDTDILWTVTDSSNNTVNGTQTITITDETDPKINAPDDIVKEATGNLTNVTLDDATVDEIFLESLIDNTKTSYPLGNTIVTFTATDSSNNSGTNSTLITITDTTAPEITLNGDSTINLMVGGSYDEPGATASDIYDGDLSNDITITDNDNLDMDSVGEYTISYDVTDTSGNQADTQSRTVIVQLEPTLPSKPRNLKIVELDDGYVKLDWKEPLDDGNTPITHYKIVYRVDGKNPSITIDNVISTNSAITGLQNEVKYVFNVFAENKVGSSEESAKKTTVPNVNGIEYTRPSAPQDVSTTVGDGYVKLLWTAPSDDGGSGITGYVIIYNDFDSQWKTVKIKNPDATQRKITGLVNDQDYRFKIQAISDYYTGFYSNNIRATPSMN